MFLHTVFSLKGKSTFDISIQLILKLQNAGANKPHEEERKKLCRGKRNNREKKELNTDRKGVRKRRKEGEHKRISAPVSTMNLKRFGQDYMTSWNSVFKMYVSK